LQPHLQLLADGHLLVMLLAQRHTHVTVRGGIWQACNSDRTHISTHVRMVHDAFNNTVKPQHCNTAEDN
jgi:membrane protein implicated in regulation of membrane protease activity